MQLSCHRDQLIWEIRVLIIAWFRLLRAPHFRFFRLAPGLIKVQKPPDNALSSVVIISEELPQSSVGVGKTHLGALVTSKLRETHCVVALVNNRAPVVRPIPPAFVNGLPNKHFGLLQPSLGLHDAREGIH